MRAKSLQRAGGMIIAFVAAVVTVLLVSRAVAGEQARPPSSRRPTLSAEERAKRFQPGPAWDRVGKGSMGQEDIETFSDYSLLWLGETFAGYNLQRVERSTYAGRDEVTLIYGTCILPEEPRGADGLPLRRVACAAPVTVHVEPNCQTRPEGLAPGVRKGPPETVRGQGQLQRFGDGHVRLWTERVSIFIDTTADPALVDQAVQQLRGVGRTAVVGPGSGLGIPDFSGCK